jgi:hypothetical protein
MAKEKTKHPLKDGSYGKIVKKEVSGMFVTSEGYKIPPFPALNIGDEVVMEDGHYKIGDGKSVDVNNATPSMDDFRDMQREMEELKQRNEALEQIMGKKGSGLNEQK